MNKNLKKIIVISLCLILSVAFVLGLVIGGIGVSRASANKYDDIVMASKADSVIFMIGDGMGFNHIRAGAAYAETEKLYMETLPQSGKVTTFSKALFAPTDSAAAGTALSTGEKVKNGNVARSKGEDIQTLSEYAKAQGKGVGIIATETLCGATPASFSSHANNRNDADEIKAQQVASDIDLFLGAGLDDYDDLSGTMEENGYSYVTLFSQLSVESNKIFGTFDEIATSEATDEEPTLSQLTAFAIDFLDEKYENGFFLMIEGSYIDKKSHSNEMEAMCKQLLGFDEAVETAVAKATALDDVAVIVTADHETGGLQYNNETKAQLSNDMFTKTKHSTADVPYFMYGDMADLPSKVNNTDLSKLTRYLLAA